MKSSMPSLFVSHGAPTIALDNSDAHQFLEKLGETVHAPSSILVVSAHW